MILETETVRIAPAERVSATDLRRVAKLANLELTADEEVFMLRDLNSILDHFDQLKELDTSAVPAMAQVSEILGVAAGLSSALREDRVRPSLDRAQVMSCAPDSDGTFFRVPKVIER
jgi:aspartyl-tRNA(Asn)/glutamyl-tRNA(Gln) amidotransferase subunit C